MFGSPAPSAARSRRIAPPNVRQAQQTRRTSAAVRAGTSRLTTPALRASHAPSSVSEDQDMVSETSFGTMAASETAAILTYVKTPELTVTLSGHFPEEVRRILGSSGSKFLSTTIASIADILPEADRNASIGQVDVLTGYSFLVTRETCFVWNPTKVRTSIYDLDGKFNILFRGPTVPQLATSSLRPANLRTHHIRFYPMCP